MKTLEAALDYAARGWPVVPLYSVKRNGSCRCGELGCRSSGKHPIGRLCPNGHKDATTNPATIRKWFKNKSRNVGIALAAAGLVIVGLAIALADDVLTEAERADLDLAAGLLGLQDVLAKLTEADRPAIRASLSTPNRRSEFAGKSVCFTGESVCSVGGQRLDR
ncbi:MAG: bifunctional DNA primase/polymerase, partial [Candidatus Krumholzibacteriota bacterium]|nr:bifunctional DNA primase/polymerase [Candidatus Krumholzibacteriota bacterium]